MTPPRFFGPLTRMRNLRLLLPQEQIVSIRHRGRAHGVFDRDRAGRQRDQPGDGRPRGVGEDVEQAVAVVVRGFGEGAGDGRGDGADGEEEVKDVDQDPAVPPDGFEAAQEGRADAGVAFVDDGVDAAG